MAIKTTRRLSRRFSVRPVRPRPLRSRTGNGGWHWFDHPEMQERIARAEADLAEGRFWQAESLEELLAHLDSLKTPDSETGEDA